MALKKPGPTFACTAWKNRGTTAGAPPGGRGGGGGGGNPGGAISAGPTSVGPFSIVKARNSVPIGLSGSVDVSPTA